MGQPRPLFCLFSVFSKKHYNFLQQINVKKVHPVYGTGIRTQDLLNVNRPAQHILELLTHAMTK